MPEINPFNIAANVVLFGIVWLSAEHVIKWLWRAYKDRHIEMHPAHVEKRKRGA